MRLSTHTTRRSDPDDGDQPLGVQAQPGIVPAAVDNLERRPALPFGLAVDQSERPDGEQLDGRAGADDHARPPPAAGPAPRPRSPRSRSASVPAPRRFVVAVDHDHGGQARARRPRCGPGPDDHAGAGAGLGPFLGEEGHAAAGPAQAAGQHRGPADGRHDHQVGPRWASSATTAVASAAGGKRRIERPVDRKVVISPDGAGAGGRAAGRGRQERHRQLGRGRGQQRRCRPAQRQAAQPARSTSSRFRTPAPHLGHRAQWHPGRRAGRRHGDDPAAHPAARRDRPAPAIPTRMAEARSAGTR